MKLLRRLRRLLPKTWPYWHVEIYTAGPVFDFWSLGWFRIVRDRTRFFYRHGWSVERNDEG